MWSSLMTRAEVQQRHADGTVSRVSLHAEVLKLGVALDCWLDVDDHRAVLRRVPYDAEDGERLAMTWTVTPIVKGSVVTLHVVAALDAPGPAALLRRRVERALVDDVLADFMRAR